jgi:hypothetical protein
VTNIVDSTHVDITPGIYMPNWRTSRTPMVASWGTADSHFSFGNGLESLSIVNSGVASTGQNGIIHVEDCYNCWIKNVRSIIGPRDHVNFIQSAHSEVRDSYFYGSTGVGAESYGIECTGASDILVINNIFHRLTAPELSPCAGSVDAYNYAYDNFFAPGGGCTDVGGNVGNCNWATHWGTHDSGGGMRLIEGNQNNGFLTDFPHGNSPLYTLFRNAFNGIDDSGSKNSYRRAIVLSAFSRGYNIVGNVLGTTGAGFSYQEASPQCCDDMYIYNLGQGSGLSGGNDARVASSLLRWGNYDTATGTTRFVASEVPTTGIPRINGNPVPANQNLPKSFFLASQPSFWGTPWGNPPWPAVGPDVTGGNGPGGHSYDIPAKLCFTHLSNDPAFPSATPAVKMFDGANCYTGSATAPPTVSISIQ